MHDARVLANSNLFRKCDSGTFLPNWTRTLSGTSIPLLILGDPAYPLRTWLIKPFSDIGLSAKQKKFNYRLSRAHVTVENAFGRLKGRWRSLMKRNDTDVKFMPTLITACCILHNMCETRGDSFEEEWTIDILQDNGTINSGASSNPGQSSGSSIRNALCDYFATS